MSKRIITATACGVALFAASCATTSPIGATTESDRVAELERQLAEARVGAASVASAAGYPEDAEPGQCFARVLVPEVTQTVTTQVVEAPERAETLIVPAVYELVDEQVLVREQSVDYRVIPATYRTVTEEVIVEEAVEEQRVVPAQYETYTESVLVRPAYASWTPGQGLFGRDYGSARAAGSTLPTGEVLCRVEVPAEYETVTRRRLVEPERVETNVIPARYESVARRVVDQPPQVVEEIIPAEYATIRVRRLVEPARAEQLIVPASFRSVAQEEVVTGERLEWREVLCDSNATPQTIAAIQRALAEAGYAPGRADGVFGSQTLRAMEAFQRANGLIVGQLTRETVEALGVPFDPTFIR